jgi:hypothetical protein
LTSELFCPKSVSPDPITCWSQGFRDRSYLLIRDTNRRPEWRLLEVDAATSSSVAKYTNPSQIPTSLERSCYVIQWRINVRPYGFVLFESSPIRLGSGKATRLEGNGCK